jgi:hypothetical protein
MLQRSDKPKSKNLNESSDFLIILRAKLVEISSRARVISQGKSGFAEGNQACADGMYSFCGSRANPVASPMIFREPVPLHRIMR